MTVVLTVEQAVRAVADPELADISIGSLGMVKRVEVSQEGTATVWLVPTFLGCPALRTIAHDVELAAQAVGAARVEVRFDHSEPWTTRSIDDHARAGLRDLGIAVADEHGVACPFCSGRDLELITQVGPASCRSAHWCSSCRNVVEVFRDAQQSAVPLGFPTRKVSYAHV
jgi:ring-1,2-phenylacetyl-CoA epoxidase subunit PaaD